MTLVREPFTKQHLDEENRKHTDTFNVRLNPEERKQFEEDKQILEQSKDSTAFKQLAAIGSVVLHDKKIGQILAITTGNSRRNKRLGIVDFE